MADHCAACPFAGCAGCEFQGGAHALERMKVADSHALERMRRPR